MGESAGRDYPASAAQGWSADSRELPEGLGASADGVSREGDLGSPAHTVVGLRQAILHRKSKRSREAVEIAGNRTPDSTTLRPKTGYGLQNARIRWWQTRPYAPMAVIRNEKV